MQAAAAVTIERGLHVAGYQLAVGVIPLEVGRHLAVGNLVSLAILGTGNEGGFYRLVLLRAIGIEACELRLRCHDAVMTVACGITFQLRNLCQLDLPVLWQAFYAEAYII